MRKWLSQVPTEGRVGLGFGALGLALAILVPSGSSLGVRMPHDVILVGFVVGLLFLVSGTALLGHAGGVPLLNRLWSRLPRSTSPGPSPHVGPAPPPGISCLMPIAAEKSAYYVGSWVNDERLAVLVITNTGPKEAEFRVELQQIHNTKVVVQIRPGPLRWANDSQSANLSPGAFGVVQIGYLGRVGKLAQVLVLRGPHGELTLEPSGIVGRRAIYDPRTQAMAQVRMMGLELRVTCDGLSEMFNLVIQFTGLDKALLQVIEWANPESPPPVRKGIVLGPNSRGAKVWGNRVIGADVGIEDQGEGAEIGENEIG